MPVTWGAQCLVQGEVQVIASPAVPLTVVFLTKRQSQRVDSLLSPGFSDAQVTVGLEAPGP